MNIKKIIQEEVNDFDWVDDVPNGVRLKKFNLRTIDIGDVILISGRLATEEEPSHEQFVTLDSVRFSVMGVTPKTNEDGYSLTIRPTDGVMLKIFQDEFASNELALGDLPEDHELRIEPITISESTDFDWVDDIEPTVLDELKLLIKDKPRINIILEGGRYKIADEKGLGYFTITKDWTWGDILKELYDEIEEDGHKPYEELRQDQKDFRDFHDLVSNYLETEYPEIIDGLQ